MAPTIVPADPEREQHQEEVWARACGLPFCPFVQEVQLQARIPPQNNSSAHVFKKKL